MGGTISTFHSKAVEAAAETIVNSVVTSVANKYKTQEELDVSLDNLEQELIKIICAINEARQRRITDEQLLLWLTKLINNGYLGGYTYRTLKDSKSSLVTTEGTRNFSISPSYRVAKRIRTIITTVNFYGDEFIELHSVLRKLKSSDVSVFLQLVCSQPKICRPVKTYLFMDHNRMFGREKEREEVMKFLFEPNTVREENVDILPIIGYQGAGKTTLALNCYYDPKVQSHFSLKIYIPFVSTGRSENIYVIFSDILKRCNSSNSTYCDENTVLEMLKQNHRSKRFLLILDMFINLDSMVWKALWDCLRCGKEGSKVILISEFDHYTNFTKNIKIGSVEPIIVDSFSEDEYLLFFNEHAFGTVEPEDHPGLAMIGREIANKMNGSIWGAKILGELLRDNMNVRFWAKLRYGILGSQSLRNKSLWVVTETIIRLLPERLRLIELQRWNAPVHFQSKQHYKTFRELMVLGSDHCKPVIKQGKNYGVQFWVTRYVFLSKCTVIMAICKPFDDQREIQLQDRPRTLIRAK